MESLGFMGDLFQQVTRTYRDGNGRSNGLNYIKSRMLRKPRRPWGKISQQPIGSLLDHDLVLNLEVKKVLPPGVVEWFFLRVRSKQIRKWAYGSGGYSPG